MNLLGALVLHAGQLQEAVQLLEQAVHWPPPQAEYH